MSALPTLCCVLEPAEELVSRAWGTLIAVCQGSAAVIIGEGSTNIAEECIDILGINLHGRVIDTSFLQLGWGRVGVNCPHFSNPFL
ncbi:hypothetical protein FKM82_027720 [Ascaphus truei]